MNRIGPLDSQNFPSLSTAQLKEAVVFDLGYLVFTEQDIIDFALANDPQEIHINKEYAQKSMFKGLIACGAQPYVTAHKLAWIPLTKNTFICGLEINNWKFFKPVYADQKVFSRVSITHFKPVSDGKTAAITWKFEFTDSNDELFQSLDVKTMHKI
jgi:acyl dehydratase